MSLPDNSIFSQTSRRCRSPSLAASYSFGHVVPLSLLKETKEDEEEKDFKKKSVLPVSTEYDMIRDKYFIHDKQDRSRWYSKFIKENKAAKDFIERVDPVARAAAFARLYLPPNRLASQNLLLSLISQHFRTLGLIDSQSSLHEEWSEPLETPPYLLQSQLALIVQRGIANAERFWEYSLPSPANHQNASEILDKEISRTIGGTPFVAEDTTPLSKEDKGDERYIKKDENGEITAASLNQLFWILTSDTKNHERDLMQAVCLTYKSFTTSKIFFTKIRERFKIAFNEPEEVRVRSIALTFKLFQTWTHEAAESIEQPVIDAAKAFVEAELKNYSYFSSKLFSQRKAEAQAIDYSAAPPVNIRGCTGLWTGNFTLFDIPPNEIARQLTILATQKYYAIQRSELLDGAWNKERLKHKSPNVVALTAQYNSLSTWAQVIILTEPSLNARIEKMKFLLDVMRELYNMQNYFSLFSLVGGFESQPLFRLKMHMKMLTPEEQAFCNEMYRLNSVEKNHKNILDLHEKALKTNQPALPCLPILLGFIFQYSENTQDVVEGNLVNIRKCKRTLGLMKDVEKFLRVRYVLLPIEQILNKLTNLDYMDDDSLYELSRDVEPDNATNASQLKNQ